MKNLISTGRILYAVPFLIFGLLNLLNGSKMTSTVPGWLPVPVFWIYFVGICFIAAAVSILIRKYARLACLLLALLLLVLILSVHIPNLFSEQMVQAGMQGILKDTSLLGAALFLAGIFGQPEPLK